jgi:hypothetical protein
MAITILRWDTGTMEFDAVVSESPEHSAVITDYPVELGANLADHMRVQPVRLSLQCVASNAPARDVTTHMDGIIATNEGAQIPIRKPLIPGADRIGLPRNIGILPLDYETTVKANVRTWSGTVSRVTAIYRELVELQRGAKLITIASDIGDWDSMLLERIGLSRTAATARAPRFDLTIRELSTAFLEQRDAIALRQVANPITQRSRPSVNGGKQATTTVKESVLTKILN